jgi:hypothetical protein
MGFALAVAVTARPKLTHSIDLGHVPVIVEIGGAALLALSL